jgi:CRISPR-associated protein Cas5d
MSTIKVKLYGEFALFNDVVANVERYSYPVPTFSAVKGILESIYWKPEFTWQVISVQVLNEIKHQNFLRNEVINQKISLDRKPIEIISNRTQRNSKVLVRPAYIVTAKIVQKAHDNANIKKHLEIFNRRVERGAYYRTPYFGIKEYECLFSFPDGNETPHESLQGKRNLGLMLHSIEYGDSNSAVFKKMQMVDGLVTVEEN